MLKKFVITLVLIISVMQIMPDLVMAQDDITQGPGTNISLTLGGGEDAARMDVAVEIVLLMTLLSLAPALLIMLTGFTRIIIVFGFLRQAMGTNQMPPNQVMIGLAMFLTFVVMAPVFADINENALQPYMAEEISQQEAFKLAEAPIKGFMLNQVREKDVSLFLDLTNTEPPESPEDLPLTIVVPSFVLSELKTAFQIGFVLFIPFLIIDMVVASVLMSMGMMMLPPVLISLPFKILLFILVDGWYLIVKSLVSAFQ
ncbi:MAG: flagellar type III secretion system pore protein FliP [bacterium]|nr:flagellar type III secretion system pore protein FliP [bacterium]MCP4799169.1 flagellar type III secretion system pore protein FliP [bacterium]